MPDSCRVSPTNEETRDYLAEARAIVSGSSRLMAERAHVQAALAFAMQQAGSVQQLSEIVAAFVTEANSGKVPTSAFVPNALLEQNRAGRLGLIVERQPDGVRLLVAQTVPAPTIHG
jgi:hypothetical protein